MSKIKAKAKRRRAELSLADKVIYGAVFIVIFILMIAGMFYVFLCADKYVEGMMNPGDIAVNSSADLVMLTYLLLFFVIPSMSVFVYGVNNVPLFPKKGITYGKGVVYKTYPLFSKDRPEMGAAKMQRMKKFVRMAGIYFLSAVIFSVAVTPVCIYSRDVINEHGEVAVYGSFNREKEKYRISDIDNAEIITYSKRKGRNFAAYRLKLRMNDRKNFSYDASSFVADEENVLGLLLYLKEELPESRFGTKVHEPLENIIKDRDFSQKETELLYKLFEK